MSRRTTLALGTALALGAGLAVLPTQAHAATVVVNTTTALSNALKNATPGTVIQVRGGTYYPTATLQSTANGSSSSRIYLQPYGSEAVKIDGSNLPDGDWIFKLTADYWTVSGITFQNSPDSAVVCQSCASTVWDNIKTINGGDSGFTLTGDSTTNNTVRNIDSYGHYDPANHGENADGIAVKFGSGSGNLITGARLYNNSDDGLDFWMFESPIVVENSLAWGNGFNRWNLPNFVGDGNGFKLGGNGVAAGHTVRNCMTWDNATGGFVDNNNPGGHRIERSTAWDNPKTGFAFNRSSGTLTKNLAVANGTDVSLGSTSTGSGNSWNIGGSWSLQSTNPAVVTGPRNTDGAIPSSNFLRPANNADVGARF